MEGNFRGQYISFIFGHNFTVPCRAPQIEAFLTFASRLADVVIRLLRERIGAKLEFHDLGQRPSLSHKGGRYTENPLFSFLALFAALFSIRVFWGFFFCSFFLSFPLLMVFAPYE